MPVHGIVSDVKHLLKESLWTTVYTKEACSFRGKYCAPFEDECLEVEDIPENIEPVFNQKCESGSNNNGYSMKLRSLAPLLAVDASDISITELVTAVHRLTPEFYQLLQSRDLPALLLLHVRMTGSPGKPALPFHIQAQVR